MVEIPSLSGQEQALAAFLVEQMRSLGLTATIDDAGNAIGVTSGDPLKSDPATRDIILLGHMDTVGGDVLVRQDGDLLYGRGTVDAKGPLAVFIAAASRAHPPQGTRLPPGTRLVVIGAVEEESATSRGARAVVPRYQPHACIIGEPSGAEAITLGYKGRLLAHYRLARPCAHTAGPDGSVADACVAWWQRTVTALAPHMPPGAKAFESVQATLRSIRTTSDGMMDAIEATAGFRLPPGVSPDDVAGLCAAQAADATLEFTGHEVAHICDRNSPLARAFINTMRDADIKPRLLHKTGTSDMNVVGPAWRCPILAYGPGDSSLDHTPQEHVSIAEFLRAIAMLNGALSTIVLGL